MNIKIRILLEVIICFILGIIISFFKEISSTIFNISLSYFYLYFYCIYFIIRLLISLLFTSIKYKLTDNYKKYSGEVAKVYLENSIYVKMMFISFFMIILGVLRVAFIVLFIIFLLLYLFSYMALVMNDNRMINKENDTDDDEIKYNVFGVDYYTKEGFELLNILTDNTFGILNNYEKENPMIILDKICRANYLFPIQESMFFGDINIFCGIINSYLRRLDINISLKKEDILSKDDEVLKKRRNDFKMTLDNDLKIVDDILKKKNYRIVVMDFWCYDFGFMGIGVVSSSVFTKLRKFKSKYIK